MKSPREISLEVVYSCILVGGIDKSTPLLIMPPMYVCHMWIDIDAALLLLPSGNKSKKSKKAPMEQASKTSKTQNGPCKCKCKSQPPIMLVLVQVQVPPDQGPLSRSIYFASK